MKHGFSVFLLIGALTLFGCQADRITSAELITAEQGELEATASKASHSTSEVRTFPGPGTLVEGASATLVRNNNGATLNIHTTDLTPGWTYTVWFVAFENPSACAATPCGLPDVGNAATDATIFGPIAGGLAGGNGTATFAGHAGGGDSPNNVLAGDGTLDNPTGAEIHFIVRCHGPAIPGLIPQQIGSFLGGCAINVCDDIQFGIFLP